jgi:pathogenesis-related protein 1
MSKRLTFGPQSLRAAGAAGILAAVLAACSSSKSGSDSPFEPVDDDGGGTGSGGGGGGSGTSSGSASGNPAADAEATGADDATTTPHGGSSGGADAGHGTDGATTGASEDANSSSSSGGSSGSGAGTDDAGNPETGRLVGITADHNAVRAMVTTSTPLPPFVWSSTIAAYAQDWANTQASTNCASPAHRPSSDLQSVGYGENLAVFAAEGHGVSLSTGASTAADAVNGWAAEKACWTYGEFMTTDVCNATCVANIDSDGCGHYTQIVWRSTMQLGCGVASCMNGQAVEDVWICNYAPAGNYVGEYPY